MRYFSFLSILVLLLLLMNCDGRKTPRESLKAAVEEFKSKQKQSWLNAIQAVPELQEGVVPKPYIEVVTDTIIAGSQFRVEIKNHNADHSTLTLRNGSQRAVDQRSKNYFSSEIKIFKNAVLLFETFITADDFLLSEQSEFWRDASLENVWVYQEACTAEETHLRISFVNPVTRNYKLYEMIVDGYGAYNFNLLEETE